MKFTKIHTNSLAVLGVGTLASMIMAVTGHECLGGNIFAGAIGLALVFAKIAENGNGV